MALEFNEKQEPKDRTKLIWGGVVLLVCAMGVALALGGRVNPNTSVVRVKHILIHFDPADPADEARARELIRSLRERILKGEDFGKLAEEYSNDPGSASRGGDLGPLPKGSLADSMEEYAWTAPVGKLSDVIKSQHGYHLAIVADRRLTDADRLRLQEDIEWQRRLSGQGGEAPGSEKGPTGNADAK